MSPFLEIAKIIGLERDQHYRIENTSHSISEKYMKLLVTLSSHVRNRSMIRRTLLHFLYSFSTLSEIRFSFPWAYSYRRWQLQSFYSAVVCRYRSRRERPEMHCGFTGSLYGNFVECFLRT